VEIDETGQHVHAGRVDLVIGLRRPVGPQRHPRRAGVANRRDAVVLDDDVDRAARRSAGAVDQHRAADDHRLVRAEPFSVGAGRPRRQRVPLQRRLTERLRGILRGDHAAAEDEQ
jgi:hypothetical protein